MKIGDYVVYTKAAARESFNRSKDSRTLVLEVEQHTCTCKSTGFTVTPMLITAVNPPRWLHLSDKENQVVYTLKCKDGTRLAALSEELVYVDPATKEVKY